MASGNQDTTARAGMVSTSLEACRVSFVKMWELVLWIISRQ